MMSYGTRTGVGIFRSRNREGSNLPWEASVTARKNRNRDPDRLGLINQEDRRWCLKRSFRYVGKRDDLPLVVGRRSTFLSTAMFLEKSTVQRIIIPCQLLQRRHEVMKEMRNEKPGFLRP